MIIQRTAKEKGMVDYLEVVDGEVKHIVDHNNDTITRYLCIRATGKFLIKF